MITLVRILAATAAILATPFVLAVVPDQGVEIEVGADKAVTTGSVVEPRPRDFLRFKAALCREPPCPETPVLMRIAADGSIWFSFGATVSFSPHGYSMEAGPHMGFVWIRIGEQPALIPIYAPPGGASGHAR